MAYHLYACWENRQFIFLFLYLVSAANIFSWISKYSDSPWNFLDQNKNVQIALVHFFTNLTTIQTTLWTVSWNLHSSLMSLNFYKISQILSLIMSSLSSQGLKTEDLFFVSFCFFCFCFFCSNFWWFICFSFYSGSRIQPLHRLVSGRTREVLIDNPSKKE